MRHLIGSLLLLLKSYRKGPVSLFLCLSLGLKHDSQDCCSQLATWKKPAHGREMSKEIRVWVLDDITNQHWGPSPSGYTSQTSDSRYGTVEKIKGEENLVFFLRIRIIPPRGSPADGLHTFLASAISRCYPKPKTRQWQVAWEWFDCLIMLVGVKNSNYNTTFTMCQVLF